MNDRRLGSGVVRAGLVVTAIGLLPLGSQDAGATTVCESLSGDRVLTAEMRYRTLSGTDECYANDYWDNDLTGAGGDELHLPCGFSAGALTGTNTANFSAYANHIDQATGDGANVLFTYRLRELNGATCPSGGGCTDQVVIHSHTTTWRVNSSAAGTCSGDSCLVYAGKEILISHAHGQIGLLDAFADVNTSSGCTSSDTGCFAVDAALCDQIINF